MIKFFSLRYSLFLIVSDLLLVVLSLVLATIARMNIRLGMQGQEAVWMLPLPVYLMACLTWLVVYTFFDIYNPRFSSSLFSELQQIVRASLMAWLTLTGLLYLTYRDVSRLQIIYFLGFCLVLVMLHRVGLRVIFRRWGDRRFYHRRVVVAGTSEVACELEQVIRNHHWTGLEMVGFVAESEQDAAANARQPILGHMNELARIIEDHSISDVIIALEWQTQNSAREVVRDLQSLPINIHIAPDYFDMAFLSLHVGDFAGMPLVTLKEPVLTPFQRVTKRTFDLLLTALLLIPALPLMGVIALAIKLDDPGPILFKQPRVGEGGRLFNMYKFRSMRVGAEKLEQTLATTDEQGRVIHKRPDDPRVTRVGRLIRRTSLDELPQFLNILMGDMSLVGPRPEMPWLVEQYEPWQRKRFEVPQGLTGWWQVNGRSDKLMHLSTDEDLYYIRHYSLWLDVKILWRTLSAVLSRRGAF